MDLHIWNANPHAGPREFETMPSDQPKKSAPTAAAILTRTLGFSEVTAAAKLEETGKR